MNSRCPKQCITFCKTQTYRGSALTRLCAVASANLMQNEGGCRPSNLTIMPRSCCVEAIHSPPHPDHGTLMNRPSSSLPLAASRVGGGADGRGRDGSRLGRGDAAAARFRAAATMLFVPSGQQRVALANASAEEIRSRGDSIAWRPQMNRAVHLSLVHEAARTTREQCASACVSRLQASGPHRSSKIAVHQGERTTLRGQCGKG